jgi:hypothetical protein
VQQGLQKAWRILAPSRACKHCNRASRTLLQHALNLGSVCGLQVLIGLVQVDEV